MYKELSYLTAFRCVEVAARHQSYTKAATELNVSQAAVSQQIRLIEGVLGVKLFIRKGRQMKLSAQGKTLASHLSQGFQTIMDGVYQIQSEPVEGSLNVTTTQSFASMVLIPKLWQFNRENPDINVRVIVSTQLEDLKHGEMDVALRFGYFEQSEFHQVTLFEDPIVPLCSPKLLKHIDLADPDNLKNCWLVDANSGPENNWQAWFKLLNVDFNREKLKWLTVDTQDMALSAVVAGHGICLGSIKLAQHFIDTGALINPFPQSLAPGIKYSLLYDEASPRLARINVFKQWLIKALSE